MVKSVKLVRCKSTRSEKEYNALEFDCGYNKFKVFADSQTLMSIASINPEDYYNLKVGDSIELITVSK